MPDTRLIKHVETKTKNVNNKATTAKTAPAVRGKDLIQRKTRASSCPRSTQTECKPKAAERINKNAIKAKPPKANSKGATCAPKEQPKPKTYSHSLYEMNSQKAFTVFAPNPKKRQDIQQKAEAELAALEHLRLSRAMGYISISSTVGGCLPLEEVRAKQQQEMQIKRRQKQVKKYILEPSPAVQK